MLGIVAGHYDYDWKEAEHRFQLATRHEAMSPHLRSWHAPFMLQSTGRLTEALVQSARVIDEDPLCQMWHMMHAIRCARSGVWRSASWQSGAPWNSIPTSGSAGRNQACSRLFAGITTKRCTVRRKRWLLPHGRPTPWA